MWTSTASTASLVAAVLMISLIQQCSSSNSWDGSSDHFKKCAKEIKEFQAEMCYDLGVFHEQQCKKDKDGKMITPEPGYNKNGIACLQQEKQKARHDKELECCKREKAGYDGQCVEVTVVNRGGFSMGVMAPWETWCNKSPECRWWSNHEGYKCNDFTNPYSKTHKMKSGQKVYMEIDRVVNYKSVEMTIKPFGGVIKCKGPTWNVDCKWE